LKALKHWTPEELKDWRCGFCNAYDALDGEEGEELANEVNEVEWTVTFPAKKPGGQTAQKVYKRETYDAPVEMIARHESLGGFAGPEDWDQLVEVVKSAAAENRKKLAGDKKEAEEVAKALQTKGLQHHLDDVHTPGSGGTTKARTSRRHSEELIQTGRALNLGQE
jgi:hypothetical protein